MSSNASYRQGAVTIHVRSVVEDFAHVTASVESGPADAARACEEAYAQIAEFLNRGEMQVVHEGIFASLSVRTAVLEARSRAMQHGGAGEQWPITYVQGRPLWGEGLAGVVIRAVRPRQAGSVWTIYEDGAPRGRAWKRNGVTFLALQDLHGLQAVPDLDDIRQLQTAQMFERASRILQAQGATYRDVARTWIYISDILDWYGGFNFARTAKYGEFGLIPDRSAQPGADWLYLPASTGIQGDNPHGAACVMDLLALSGSPEARAMVTQITNVRQKDAFKYGSAFSRGVAIGESDAVHTYVSGTAAIDEQGKSLFPGDCRAQVHCTLDNVEAVVAQTGASLQDICQATIFLKRAEDLSVYRQVAQERGLAEMPAIYVLADVCRDELLFEMDTIAALPLN